MPNPPPDSPGPLPHLLPHILMMSRGPLPPLSKELNSQAHVTRFIAVRRLNQARLLEMHEWYSFTALLWIGEAQDQKAAALLAQRLRLPLEFAEKFDESHFKNLLKPVQGAEHHYQEAQVWEAAAIESNPLYQRELAIVKKAVSQKRWKQALDLGAGFGRATRALKENVEQFTLLEASATMLERARALGVKGEMLQASIDAPWPLKPQSFDLIVGLQIINHAYNLKDFLAQLEVVLKPGGEAYLSVGSASSIKQLLSNPKPSFLIDGYRRLHLKSLLKLASTLGWQAELIGGSGLLSPWRSLHFVDSLNFLPLLWDFNHLAIVHFKKSC